MSIPDKTFHPVLANLLRKHLGEGAVVPGQIENLIGDLDEHLHALESEDVAADPAAVPGTIPGEIEERYHLLLTHSPDAIVIVQAERVRYANPAAARMGHISVEEIVGRSIFDFIPRESHAELVGDLARVQADREPLPLRESRLKRLNGEAVDVELTASLCTYQGEEAVMVIYRDTSDQKRVNQMLRDMLTGISAHVGAEFYPHFVESLARTLRVDIAYLAEVSPDVADEYRTCAFWADGELRENFHYRRTGTPCETVVGKKTEVYARDVAQRFPQDRFLKGENIESYIGVPLFDGEGKPQGLIAVMSRKPFSNSELPVSIMKIFAERASAEMERTRALSRLLNQERHFRKLMDQAADGIVVASPDGSVTYANERTVELFGYTLTEILGRKFRDFLISDEVHLLGRDLKNIKRGTVLNIQRTLLRKDGEEFRGDISAILLDDGSIQVFIRDMTERHRVEEERKSYLETIAMLEEVAIELDRTYKIVRVSDSWEKLFHDQSGESPIGRQVENWFHPDYQYYLVQNLENLFEKKKTSVVVHIPVPLSNGTNMWLEGKFIGVKNSADKVTGLRGVLRDVTLDHLTDRQITFYAYYDNLTGLPNRIRMEENLNRALNRAEHANQRLAVGFIDLDNFDEINNYMGHRVGDLVLLYVTERLRDALGTGENLYRWGGDKFVVLLTDIGDIQAVRQIGRRLMDICRTPLEIEEELIHISYSVGFAIYPDDGLTTDILMGQADRALGYAKSQGRFNFQLSGDVPRRGIYRDQISIRNKLAMAIARREITAYFQPKVSAREHKIVGVEALARWFDESGKPMISPAMFIPVAENLGLISDLGEQIMEQSLELLSGLRAKGRIIQLAVNVSRRQLFDPFYVDRVCRTIEKYRMTPKDVTLEITESIAMLEVDFAIERLHKLHEAGFHLSIDDFGTGYSTLSQLHEMPVSELKIDMSFVRRIDTYEGLQVVQAIANMGRALNLDVVAEGVETSENCRRLEDIGINLLQGHLFSKPISGEALIQLLEQESPGD
ncbi:MAG: EAL domain-containing protein [bacterium]|nr:EAL domain-containing protein [bacterium]